MIYHQSPHHVLLHGDCLHMLRVIPSQSVNCCVTSPPYFGLRDYGVDGQIGFEETPEVFVQKLVEIFREVKRVLRDDGTLWLNLGDSYAANRSCQPPPTNTGNKLGHPQKASVAEGLKPKDLIGIPWRVAFALQADGWYLRQDIIWHKPNPMPESVKDRCTKAHEYIFLLSKSSRYYFDNESIKVESKQDWGTRDRSNGKYHKEGGGLQPHSGLEKSYTMANKRSVWTVTTKPFKGAHFATFPPDLIEPCILAGCPRGGVVLDPFNGAGTTGVVAQQHKRSFLGIELNSEYCRIAVERWAKNANDS